jgi:hypothetical protein
MTSPFTRRWARLGLYVGVAAAAGITLYWVLAARRADWADWSDDPALEAHRWASTVSFPVSFLVTHLWPALTQFRYWPWMVVLGPPLNGMALGALAGFLRDRAGTRDVFDVMHPRWTTTGVLIIGVLVAWIGFSSLTLFAIAVPYAFWAPPAAWQSLLTLIVIAWLAVPLGLIGIKRAIPATGRRLALVIALVGVAVLTTIPALRRFSDLSPVLMITRHALAWLAIAFGAIVAAAPDAPTHGFPSLRRLRLTRSALGYALIASATPGFVLSALSLPALVLLALQIWYARRGRGDAPGVPPARLARWGCAAVAVPLGYAALSPWWFGPQLTLPRVALDPGLMLARISLLLGILLIQIGVWRAATAPPAPTPPDALPVADAQPVTPEAAFAGLIVAAILFWWSVTASYAGWRATPGTETMQLAAGVLLYLSGRAGAWPLARVFGATVGLLALYVLLAALR